LYKGFSHSTDGRWTLPGFAGIFMTSQNEGSCKMFDQDKTGKFIAESRKQKGLTQRDLADKLGINDNNSGMF